MKVTVAVPAYNAGAYIDEAIDSVLAQDFDSFELIVVDDASRDETWKRLRRYAKHPRVRLYRNRRNLGVGGTRNRLIGLARGEYVMPSDADNLLIQGALERFSACLDRHPTVGAVYADVLELMTDRDHRVIREPLICGKDYRKAWDLIENAVNHAGSLIRRSLLKKVGGYDETVFSVDDWSLWLKLAEITRFMYLEGEIFYIWRRHPSSLTLTDRNWQRDVDKIRLEAIRRRYGVEALSDWQSRLPEPRQR